MNKNGFIDKLNTAVFTTSFVLQDKKPILFVSHYDQDGAWEFLSDDEFDNFEKAAKVVSLEEIINLDPSIIELLEMQEGYHAFRKSKQDEWIIKKRNE
jgi:hypothetical protein